MVRHNEIIDFQPDSFSGIQTYDASVCIMTKILALMSGQWKPIILYLIRNNINRFGLLQKAMPLISRKVLTHQLRELEADDLVSRIVLEPNIRRLLSITLPKGQIIADIDRRDDQLGSFEFV